MNNSPGYTFAIAQTTLPLLEDKATGAYRQVFKDRNFPGHLERIVIRFGIEEGSITRIVLSAINHETGEGFDPQTGERIQTVSQEKYYRMPIICQAFGTKGFLWWKRYGLVASVSGTRAHTSREELVEFVLREAGALAQRYGVKPEVTYHESQRFLGAIFTQQQLNSH